ncbi:hypothetical protein ES703_121281 [subsurface metagenome]
MQDFTGFFSIFEGLHQSVFGVEYSFHGGGVADLVELVEVYIVGAESFEAEVEVFFYFFVRVGEGLGGDENVFAPSLDGFADTLLAGGIAVGGIEEVDAQFEAFFHDFHGFCVGASLDGNTAETQSRYHHSGPAESYFFQGGLLSVGLC